MSRTRTRRVSALMGCRVVTANGQVVGVVKDVRLAPTRVVSGLSAELTVIGLVVSKRHTGALLGYDRRQSQGPWMVRVAVRWLHRDSGYLPWDSVEHMDWRRRVVQVAGDNLEPLDSLEAS